MRRRLPPIFTISTEAVEFDFKAGMPYGRYKQRRITRPRAQTLRQSTTSSFGSGMGVSPPVVYVHTKSHHIHRTTTTAAANRLVPA
jgi:hypothetical protein